MRQTEGKMTRWVAALQLVLLVSAALSSALSTGAMAQPFANSTASHAAAKASPAAVMTLTAETRETLAWVLASRDHGGKPFMVVDKRAAQASVFNGRGQLLGAAPALLGMATGDVDAPGNGMKPVSQIKPDDRITPAGRFATEPGRGLKGDAIVWFDYAAGLAIHRVRPGAAEEARTQRLASRVATAQRVSLGCVVLSPAFFDAVVQPSLGQQAGVIYVLPETRPLKTLLASLAAPSPVLAVAK